MSIYEHGTFDPLASVEDVAAYLTTPEFRFSADPGNALNFAISNAAQYIGKGNRSAARRWTEIAVLVEQAAANEFVSGGAPLDDLCGALGVARGV